MKVFVYWNIRSKCWSIRDVKTGLVTGHALQVCLTDAVFKVSEAGRQRVLRTGVKNVHAGVVGTLVAVNELDLDDRPNVKVTYNPTKYAKFVHRTSGYAEPVESASVVLMTARLVGAPSVRAFV